MSFLVTAWLGALAALAVPVALHFVSRGHRRRLRIGTVRLLRGGASFQARRLRPGQLLLLLVRCLLLAALALALAEPRAGAGGTAGDRGWVLISPSLLGSEPAAVGELAAQGHEVRVLSPGLPRPSADAAPQVPVDAWSLLREADAAAPAGRPFFVFADAGATVLRGRRPTLRRPVQWTSLDGEPIPDGAVHEPEAVPRRAAVHFEEDRKDDAAYVTAALEAAAEHLGAELTVDHSSSWTDAGFVVWLDAEPVPEAAFGPGRVVLSDGLGRWASCSGRAAFGRREIELRRCSPAEPVDGEAVLQDAGDAQPLLTASRRNGALWYRLHGRFHPMWSDLVLGPALPEWLAGLLDGTTPRAALEVAGTADGQAEPRGGAPAVDGEPSPSRAAERWPVEYLTWGAVALLFALERAMALKRPSAGGATT